MGAQPGGVDVALSGDRPFGQLASSSLVVDPERPFGVDGNFPTAYVQPNYNNAFKLSEPRINAIVPILPIRFGRTLLSMSLYENGPVFVRRAMDEQYARMKRSSDMVERMPESYMVASIPLLNEIIKKTSLVLARRGKRLLPEEIFNEWRLLGPVSTQNQDTTGNEYRNVVVDRRHNTTSVLNFCDRNVRGQHSLFIGVVYKESDGSKVLHRSTKNDPSPYLASPVYEKDGVLHPLRHCTELVGIVTEGGMQPTSKALDVKVTHPNGAEETVRGYAYYLGTVDTNGAYSQMEDTGVPLNEPLSSEMTNDIDQMMRWEPLTVFVDVARCVA
jgi:hypothetical protein